MTRSKLTQHGVSVLAIAALVVAMGGSWGTQGIALAGPSGMTTVGSAHSAGSGPVTAPSPSGPTSSGSMSGTTSAGPPNAARGDESRPSIAKKSNRKELAGKLNLNAATEEQLMVLPTVGPSKAERIVTWRKKNGGFKRVADLRRVKGFGYRTFKKLEPFLDVKGDTTLAPK